VRNLRKRLRQIDALQQKLGEGGGLRPTKEQLEKLSRRAQVEEELQQLEAGTTAASPAEVEPQLLAEQGTVEGTARSRVPASANRDEVHAETASQKIAQDRQGSPCRSDGTETAAATEDAASTGDSMDSAVEDLSDRHARSPHPVPAHVLAQDARQLVAGDIGARVSAQTYRSRGVPLGLLARTSEVAWEVKAPCGIRLRASLIGGRDDHQDLSEFESTQRIPRAERVLVVDGALEMEARAEGLGFRWA